MQNCFPGVASCSDGNMLKPVPPDFVMEYMP